MPKLMVVVMLEVIVLQLVVVVWIVCCAMAVFVSLSCVKYRLTVEILRFVSLSFVKYRLTVQTLRHSRLLTKTSWSWRWTCWVDWQKDLVITSSHWLPTAICSFCCIKVLRFNLLSASCLLCQAALCVCVQWCTHVMCTYTSMLCFVMCGK